MSATNKQKKVGYDRSTDQTTTTPWLPPQWLTDAVQPVDLDPSALEGQMPWSTARVMLTPKEDGPTTVWRAQDFVFYNPRGGARMPGCMAKSAKHGHGFTLSYARTDTQYFFDSVFRHPNATALFFFEGRLKFCHLDGTPGGSAGAPSVLIAYGPEARRRLVEAVRAKKLFGRIILLGADQTEVWQLGRRPSKKAKATRRAA